MRDRDRLGNREVTVALAKAAIWGHQSVWVSEQAGDSQPHGESSGEVECPCRGAQLVAQGSTSGGRRAEPWIQALKVYQEQREADRPQAGREQRGSRDGSRPEQGPPWPSLRGCSTGSNTCPA